MGRYVLQYLWISKIKHLDFFIFILCLFAVFSLACSGKIWQHKLIKAHILTFCIHKEKITAHFNTPLTTSSSVRFRTHCIAYCKGSFHYHRVSFLGDNWGVECSCHSSK